MRRAEPIFRAALIVGDVLAGGGAVASGLSHVLSIADAAPVAAGRMFTAAVLAVFPLGGFSILIPLRVGRVYGIPHARQGSFILQRAPTWLRRLTLATLVYALIVFVLEVLAPRGRFAGAHVPLDATAMIGWCHLVIATTFTVALSDPKLVGR